MDRETLTRYRPVFKATDVGDMPGLKKHRTGECVLYEDHVAALAAETARANREAAARQEAETKLAALVGKWRSEASDYPLTVPGARYAATAVKLCADELAGALAAAAPAPQPASDDPRPMPTDPDAQAAPVEPPAAPTAMPPIEVGDWLAECAELRAKLAAKERP